MRLTRFTDNALRCLVFLAVHPDRIVTVAEVANRMGMSQDHLLKVVQRLSELGYVSTVRGRHGGVRLAAAPESISVADVVRCTEESLSLVPCVDTPGEPCPVASCCLLPEVFREAMRAFFDELERHSVADLVAGTPLGQAGPSTGASPAARAPAAASWGRRR